MSGSRMILGVLIVFVLFSGAFATEETNSYFIQIGPYDNETTSTYNLNNLTDLGYAPLTNVVSDGQYFLHTGETQFFMDAYLANEDLAKDGYKNTEIIVTKIRQRKLISSKLNRSNSDKVFDIIEPTPMLTLCTIDKNDPDYTLINNMVTSSTTELLENTLNTKLSSRSDTDAMKGWMNLKLAYTKIRKGENEQSRNLFKSIAEGKIKAPPEVRVEAMTRYARYLHRDKNRIRAYRAYNEILQYTTDSKTRGEIIGEISGLMMELARSSKGTLSECREYYENSAVNIDSKDTYTAMLLELMHLETWYYEDNFDKCIEEGVLFLNKFKTNPNTSVKLIATGSLFIGLAYEKKGQLANAEKILKDVLDMPLTATDNWKDIPDLKRHALAWLIIIAGRSSDTELMNELKEYERTHY